MYLLKFIQNFINLCIKYITVYIITAAAGSKNHIGKHKSAPEDVFMRSYGDYFNTSKSRLKSPTGRPRNLIP